jgi:hypothetical protein
MSDDLGERTAKVEVEIKGIQGRLAKVDTELLSLRTSRHSINNEIQKNCIFIGSIQDTLKQIIIDMTAAKEKVNSNTGILRDFKVSITTVVMFITFVSGVLSKILGWW